MATQGRVAEWGGWEDDLEDWPDSADETVVSASDLRPQASSDAGDLQPQARESGRSGGECTGPACTGCGAWPYAALPTGCLVARPSDG